MPLLLVVGSRGSGKTTFLQFYERHLEAQRVVWDPLGHWEEKESRRVVHTDDPEEAAALAIRLAPSTLVLDEAHLAFPSHGPPRGSALGEIVRVGRQARAHGQWRRRGPVGLLAATQRPSEIWTTLRGLLDVLWIGNFPRSVARGDLEWLARAVQQDGASVLDRVSALRFGRFWEVKLSG